MPVEDLIPIAHILRPQGRKGEVLAELLTDLPDQFTEGREVLLAKNPQSVGASYVLENHWSPMGKNAGRIVLKFANINSISEAEALADLAVLIPVEELPTLEDDTFYIRDLVDCTLFNGSQLVGKIIDVQFATSPDGRIRLDDAAPLLEVETSADTEPILIPFAKAFLDRVDVSAKKVFMNLPDGLLLDPLSDIAE